MQVDLVEVNIHDLLVVVNYNGMQQAEHGRANMAGLISTIPKKKTCNQTGKVSTEIQLQLLLNQHAART